MEEIDSPPGEDKKVIDFAPDRPHAMAAGSAWESVSDSAETYLPSSVGQDASWAPWDAGTSSNEKGWGLSQIGALIPQSRMLGRDELYAAALTPSGHNATYILPEKAMRNGWKPVKNKRRTDPLDPGLIQYIHDIHRKYDGSLFDKTCISLCETFGRCLFFLLQIAPRGRKTRWEPYVTVIDESNINYNDRNEIESYDVIIPWGNELREFHVSNKNAVLWKNDVDPFSNMHRGRVTLIPAYKDLVRAERIKDGSTKVMEQRGLGMLLFQVEGADEPTLEKFAKKYKNPSQHSVMFTDERFIPHLFDGMKASYNLDNVLRSLGKEFSKATGIPLQIMEGQNEGQQSGAEASQDSQGERYSVIQERYEKFIIENILLFDSKEDRKFDLKRIRNREINPPFELDFEIEVKMDRQKRSNILATEATALQQLQWVFTINQVHQRLDLPLIEGSEGEMLYGEYIKKKQSESLEKYSMMPGGEQPLNKEGEPMKAPQDPAKYEQRDLEKERKQEKPREKSLAPNMNEDSFFNFLNTGDLKQQLIIAAKKVLARQCLEQGDSFKMVDEHLRKVFGESLGRNTLSKIRQELDKDK